MSAQVETTPLEPIVQQQQETLQQSYQEAPAQLKEPKSQQVDENLVLKLYSACTRFLSPVAEYSRVCVWALLTPVGLDHNHPRHLHL